MLTFLRLGVGWHRSRVDHVHFAADAKAHAGDAGRCSARYGAADTHAKRSAPSMTHEQQGLETCARSRHAITTTSAFPSLRNQPEVMINASKNFDDQGNLTDQQTKDLIGELLANLVKKAGKHKA
jgi:hypothetical protein